jgi:hypothetical protein
MRAGSCSVGDLAALLGEPAVAQGIWGTRLFRASIDTGATVVSCNWSHRCALVCIGGERGVIVASLETGDTNRPTRNERSATAPEMSAVWKQRTLIGIAAAVLLGGMCFALTPQYGSQEIEGTAVFYRIWRLTGQIEYRYHDGWKPAGPIFEQYTVPFPPETKRPIDSTSGPYTPPSDEELIRRVYPRLGLDPNTAGYQGRHNLVTDKREVFRGGKWIDEAPHK